jgi:hypothetical protein
MSVTAVFRGQHRLLLIRGCALARASPSKRTRAQGFRSAPPLATDGRHSVAATELTQIHELGAGHIWRQSSQG